MKSSVKIKAIFHQLRWKQWYKSLWIFAVLLWFPHNWQDHFLLILAGAMAFNLTASIVYIFNDIKDVKYDRRHPVKKKRPLAAKDLSLVEGYSLAVSLSGLVLVLIGLIEVPRFALLLLIYLLANYLYSSWIKHIAYIDSVFVALFSVMRVLAGFVLLDIQIAWFFAALAFSIVLFVIMLQRTAELQIVSKIPGSTRPALRGYSQKSLKFFLTFLLMVSVILYFITTSVMMPELVLTDVLYFALLLTSYQEIHAPFKENEKADGIIYALKSRRSIVLLTLLVLTVITLIVWFK